MMVVKSKRASAAPRPNQRPAELQFCRPAGASSGSDDDVSLPQGDGYGAVTVDTGGNVSLTGALADGTTLKTSLGHPLTAPVSKNGQWPVYASLYRSEE